MDTSSMTDGRRQSLWPAKVSVGQYATAAAWAYVVAATACCHMRPVTLSVTVPSPLSVVLSGLGAPTVTSACPLGIGHSAQFGSTQSAGAARSRTAPVAQVEAPSAVQPAPASVGAMLRDVQPPRTSRRETIALWPIDNKLLKRLARPPRIGQTS